MSNYCNLYCDTCKEYSLTDINRGHHVLRALVKAAPYMKAAIDMDETGYLEFNVMAHGDEIANFACNHLGHDLYIDDESLDPNELLRKGKHEGELGKGPQGCALVYHDDSVFSSSHGTFLAGITIADCGLVGNHIEIDCQQALDLLDWLLQERSVLLERAREIPFGSRIVIPQEEDEKEG